MNPDIAIIRDLAKHYLEICNKPVQQERRRLWRLNNSLKGTRPLIYVRAFAWKEMPESRCECKDTFYHPYEGFLRRMLFWDSLGDDSVFEPWISLNATYKCSGWGVSEDRHFSGSAGGSWKADHPIRELGDIEKLKPPRHEIDEEETARNAERLEEILGGIIPINIDRSTCYRMWEGDLSSHLGMLRGIENVMLDMIDHPDWLHRLMTFLRDGILAVYQQAEQAGDWGLCAHENQAMAYAEELPDPAANTNDAKLSQLWGYQAAQELTLVSPKMHNEFVLQYQIPILAQFGLSAYGCCEDMTRKIDNVRQIPNLRRIAVSPFSNVAKCAEQIGGDYVISYRPSPTDMVGYGFDEARITTSLKRDLNILKNTHFDITLKDVETVEGDPCRVRNWVSLARKVIAETFD